jgi:hypothetical protein
MLLPNRSITLQGYLFSHPVPASELLALIEQLPVRCKELDKSAQLVAPQTIFTARAGERRKGSLALVVD